MQSAVYKEPYQTPESTKTSIFQKSCQTSESLAAIEALRPKRKNILSQTSTSSNMQEKHGSIVFANLPDEAKQIIKNIQDIENLIKWNQKAANEKCSSPDLNLPKTHSPSPEFSWNGYNACQSQFSSPSPSASDVLSENSSFKARLSKENELSTGTLNQAARQSCRYADSRKNSVDCPNSQTNIPFFVFSTSSSTQNINDEIESKFSSQSTFLPDLTACSDNQAPSFSEGLNLSSPAEHSLNEYPSDSSAYTSNSLFNFIDRHSNNQLNANKTVTISSDPSPPPYSRRKQISLPSYKAACSPDTSAITVNLTDIMPSDNHLNTSACLTSVSHSNLTFGAAERKRNIPSSNYELKELPPQPSSYLSVPFSSGVILQNSNSDTFGSVNSADANSRAFEIHSTSSCNTFDPPMNSNNNDKYEITVNSRYNSTPLSYNMSLNSQNTDSVVSSNKKTTEKTEFTRSQSTSMEAFIPESSLIKIDSCFESHQISKNKAHRPKHISLSFPSGNPSMTDQDNNRFSQNNLLNNNYQQNTCLFPEIEKGNHNNSNIPKKSALNSTSKNVQHDFEPFCKNVDIPSKNIYWRPSSIPESRHTSTSRMNIANPKENKCIRGSTSIRNKKYLVSSPPYKSDMLPKTSNIQSFERFPSNEVYERQNNNKISSAHYMTSRPKEVNPTIYNYKELQSNRLLNTEHKYNTLSQPQQNTFVPAINDLRSRNNKNKKSRSSTHIENSHGSFTFENKSPNPKFAPALQKTNSGFLEAVGNSGTSSDHSHSNSNTLEINDLQTSYTLPINNEHQFFDAISPREKNILDSIIDGLAAEVEKDLQSSNTPFSSNAGLRQLDDEDLKVILEIPWHPSQQAYEKQSNANSKHDIPQKADISECFAGISKNRSIHQENDCIGADYFNFLHHSSKRMRREGPSKVDIEYEINSSPAGIHLNDNGSEKKDESEEIVGNSTNVTNHAIHLFHESKYEDFFKVITVNQFPEEQKRMLCKMWKAAIILNFEQKTRQEVTKQMRVVFLENNPPPLTIQNV